MSGSTKTHLAGDGRAEFCGNGLDKLTMHVPVNVDQFAKASTVATPEQKKWYMCNGRHQTATIRCFSVQRQTRIDIAHRRVSKSHSLLFRREDDHTKLCRR